MRLGDKVNAVFADLPDDSRRAVGGRVVDDDLLPVCVRLRQDAIDTLANVRFMVERGGDNADKRLHAITHISSTKVGLFPSRQIHSMSLWTSDPISPSAEMILP